MPVTITADILNTHLPHWTWVDDGPRVVGTPDGEPVEDASIAVRVRRNGHRYAMFGACGSRIWHALAAPGETVEEIAVALRFALEREAEDCREEAEQWIKAAEDLESAAQGVPE